MRFKNGPRDEVLSGSKECSRKYEKSGGLICHAVEGIEPTESVCPVEEGRHGQTTLYPANSVDSTISSMEVCR